MRYRRFRWWHGWLAGVLVGAALWQADAALEGSAAPKVVTGITLEQFARYVRTGALPGAKPLLEDVRIHPAVDAKNVVTGRVLVPSWTGVSDRSFEFVAAVPFKVPVPGTSAAESPLQNLARSLFGGSPPPRPARAVVPPRVYASVREFLAEVAPGMGYRYVWWEEPRARAALWVGGATLALGVLLPVTLMVLVRLGVLSPPPVEEQVVERERLAGEGPEKAAPAVDMAAVDTQLAAAIEEAGRQVGDGTVGGAEVGPEEGAGARKPVALGPGEKLQAVEEVREETEYDRGEFYPVSRGHPDKAHESHG